MTRLKDALEKAALTGAAESRTHEFSPPRQVVPDAWQLDAGDPEPLETPVAPPVVAAPVTVAPVGAPVVSQPMVREQPAAASELPPAADAAITPDTLRPEPRSRAALDFWASYKFGSKGLGKVVVGPNADHGLVEQYRRLGAALHHHQLQTGARTLMVTSAAASEGKTLTATNLALTLSHSYKRSVLLVDADLRRPSVHEILRLPNSVGLSDLLRHPDRTATMRFHTISPTLFALTAGRPDSDPMAGLVSDTMNRILADAAQQFDWVIVDTPPVALLPDANLLAAMIDTALLVVGANSTPYPLVKRAVEAIGEQRILGVVLNRMTAADIVAAYSYYYGYGAYAYGAARRKGFALRFWKKNQKTDQKVRPEAAAG